MPVPSLFCGNSVLSGRHGVWLALDGNIYIIGTTDTILREIDQKMLTSAVILDMSTAFDSINHETLILKLQDTRRRLSKTSFVGFNMARDANTVIQWFCSYLH